MYAGPAHGALPPMVWSDWSGPSPEPPPWYGPVTPPRKQLYLNKNKRNPQPLVEAFKESKYISPSTLVEWFTPPLPLLGGKARRLLNLTRTDRPHLLNTQSTVNTSVKPHAAMQRRTRVFKTALETTMVLMVLNWHRPCTFRMPKQALNNAYETALILSSVFSYCLANIIARIPVLHTLL